VAKDDKKSNLKPSLNVRKINKDFKTMNSEITSIIYGNELDRSLDNTLNKTLNIVNSLDNKTKNITGGSNIVDFFNNLNYKNVANEITDKKKDKDKKDDKDFLNLINNLNLDLSSTTETQRLFRYEDFNIIEAYLPFISKCLDAYRDNILAPDDITKKSINFAYNNENLNESNEIIFSNLKLLNEKYKIGEKSKTLIRDSLKLGDQFLLILNTSQEFKRILTEDSELFYGDQILDESSLYWDKEDETDKNLLEYIQEAVNSDIKKDTEKKSIDDVKKNIIDDINKNLKFYEEPSDVLSDGKKISNKYDTETVENYDIKGSIVKIVDPQKIMVLEIDETLIGYIYFERQTGESLSRTSFLGSDSFNNMGSNAGNDYFNVRSNNQSSSNSVNGENWKEALSKVLTRGLSQKMNKKFLQDNVEFQNLIYNLLKEDYFIKKGIKFTFISPDQMIHFKLNSDKTYGKSKLADILFFAKIYLAILITNTMQKVSRGRDKRAFYVDVGLEDDIEGSIQSVIKDIKSSEITANSFQNIDTMFKTIGAFEDYFIPTLDGSKPLEIDTISGMDVDIENDFLNELKKSIISGIGVPANYIEAEAEVDFAKSLSMSNSNFVRDIIYYQSQYEVWFSQIFRILYKNEFIKDKNIDNVEDKQKRTGDDLEDIIKVDLESIVVKFPSPVYLNLMSFNDQISNIQTTVEFITALYFGDQDDEVLKRKFKLELIKQQFLSNMEWEMYDKILDELKLDQQEEALDKPDVGDGTGDDLGGDLGDTDY